MTTKIFQWVSFLTIICLFSKPNVLSAQKIDASPLKKMEGYYRFQQQKNLHIHILAVGDELKLVQEWDNKEIMFQQQSALGFINAEGNFSLVFAQGTDGEIDQFTAFGKDIWIRDTSYRPDPIRTLNPEEERELQKVLNTKAEALLRVVNDFSTDHVRAFMLEHASESFRTYQGDDFVNRIQLAHRFTGGLKNYQVKSSNAKVASGNYQAVSTLLDNIFEFNLQLDQNNKIKLFNSRVIANPAIVRQKGNEGETVSQIKKTVEALAQKDLFSGAVLIAHRDRVLFEYACGEAVKESHVQNTLDTRFNLGSMNKMFTSLAIMQLAEKGKLDIKDPVSSYLDTTWLPSAIADKITIEQLLTHTSGLGDFFNVAFEKTASEQFITLDGYKPFIKTNTLAFEPGSDWQYSNTGMLVLGAIIEKVSGMDYFEYVKKYIYKPASMLASDVRVGDTDAANIAFGYTFAADGTYVSNQHSSYARPSPAGGGYSTINDLYRFARALTSYKLVPDTLLTKMFTDYKGRQYGYGFQLWDSPEQTIIGHSGGAPGISAVEYIFRDSGYVVVVLSNYDGGSYYTGEYIRNKVKTLLK